MRPNYSRKRPAGWGAYSGRLTEIKRESQPTDPFPFYGLIGVGFEIHLSPRHSRESGNPEGAAKPASRNQVQIATSGSPLPLRERARVRVSRAQARLCGRDARVPGAQTYPSVRGWGGDCGGKRPARNSRKSRVRQASERTAGGSHSSLLSENRLFAIFSRPARRLDSVFAFY